MEEDSFNQTFFTLETTLSKEMYQNMERQFQKEKTKIFSMIYKNEAVGKLHSFILEEEEYIEAFALFENNCIILPEKFNPNLINVIIHYFYFKEIKPLSIKMVFDFLDFVLFLHINELISKIIIFLKTNLTDAEKTIFIRKNIFRLIMAETSNGETSNGENNLKPIFEDCDVFLLKNNKVEEYLAFYAHDFFSNSYFTQLDIEAEFIKRVEMMNNFKIDGIYIVKLLILFKEYLTKVKIKDDANFDFKDYAEKAIEKFVKLKELDPKPLNEILYKLELNTKDFKIKILNEKIAFLESEMVSLKQK